MTARAILLRVTILATALMAALIVGEGVLRAVAPPRLHRKLPEVRYASHPVRRFVMLPDQQAFTYGAPVRIDARGFRVPSTRRNATEEDLRILAVGDSFTFGLGVADDQTWPAQLEQILSDAGRPTAVTNAGTISYGVFQEMDLLRHEGLATRPDIVIHALYWNDFMNAAPPPPDAASVIDENGYFRWDGLSERRSWPRRAANAAASISVLASSVQEVASRFRNTGARTPYADAYGRLLSQGLSADEWRPIIAFYEEMNRLAAAREFTPVVILLPVRDILKKENAEHHPYVTAARQMLEEMKLPFVDGFRVLSQARNPNHMYLPEQVDAHLNADGFAALAEAVSTLELLADVGRRRTLQ